MGRGHIVGEEGSTMAIYHCTFKMVKRSEGKSAVAAAAYRSGEKIENIYDGLTHDYTRKETNSIFRK